MGLLVYCFLYSMKSFVSEDSNIVYYIHINVITQTHVSINSLKDPWMLVLFRGHASMKQKSLSKTTNFVKSGI